MQKYQIVHKKLNLILCKLKHGTNYYARYADDIPNYLVVVETTKDEAETARDYRNTTQFKGWEIKAV